MSNYFWSDWYSGWGWMLWFGCFFLFFSSIGNWGYTYQAHRRFTAGESEKDSLDYLAERYANGEIQQAEFQQVKDEILAALSLRPERRNSSSRPVTIGRPLKT